MKLKIALSALIYAIISMIVHSGASFIGMSYYQLPQYFNVWSRLMMTEAGPPGAEFFIYSFVFALIGGGLLTAAYLMVGKCLPGGTPVKRGLAFAGLLIMVSAIPGFFAMVLLINMPLYLQFSWLIEGALIYAIWSVIAVKLLK
jgi:hypothetical protein